MSRLNHIVASGFVTLSLVGNILGQEVTSTLRLDFSAPVLPYSVVNDYPDVPPEANFGEVAAVALDDRQHLYVFNRGPKPLMEFDAAGRYVRELAQGIISHAHSVRFDRNGDLWLVDDADHHVVKLDRRGRVMMVLGRRGRSGDNESLFNRPTDVAVNSRGEVYVTDGYVNSRVVKFSRDGKFLLSWGSKGTGPGQFDIPHAIIIDSTNKVYVADRENRRIQVFDPNGHFVTQWTGFEYPQALYLSGDQSLYVGDTSRVVKLDLSGRVTGVFGTKGKGRGQVSGIHGLAIGRNGELFTAELLNWRVQKFVLPSPGSATKNTGNTEAYRLYLLGRFHWNKRTVSDLRKAIEYFQQAVIADSNYAPAYAGLADSYMLLSESDGAAPREAIPKARQAALKALSLNSQLAEAHTALGLVLFDDYDLAGAEREYKRALELNSQDPTAHQRYGLLLTCLGRHEEGLAEVRRALEIEPRALVFNRSYGSNLFYARRYEESIAQLKKTRKLDANWAPAYASLANAYWMKGDYAKSVKEFAKYREVQGRQRDAALVRESFSKAGWEGFLRMRIGEQRGSTTNSYGVAEYHAALGEKDEAFVALNKAYENHEYGLLVIKVDPRLDSLRHDPRFQDLLRRVGFSTEFLKAPGN